MLTKNDISKLIEAEKEVFPTKSDFENLKKDFNKLQTSVDIFSKISKTNQDELKVLNHRVSKLEHHKKY
jgi:hypothetical protein